MMNTYEKPFCAKSRELTDTPPRVKYVNQSSAAPGVGKVIGVCPECGNPLLGLEDHITCSRAKDAGCIFTIFVKELEVALYDSLSTFLVEILTDVRNFQELLHDMGSSHKKEFWIDLESLIECSVYIELRIVKDRAGTWTIGVTCESNNFASDKN